MASKIFAAAIHRLQLYSRGAAVVVEGVDRLTFVAEVSTTMIVDIILSVFGIGFFCWLLFTLAVYALPFFSGLSAGFAALHTGSGVISALIVGGVAGGTTLAIGQIVFPTV